MAGGRVVDIGRQFERKLADATVVNEDNKVMAINASSEVILCDNAVTPYGIFYGTTISRLDRTIGKNVYSTGAQIDHDSSLFRSGWADLPLDINHTAIAIGDMLMVGASDDGRVVKGDPDTAAEYTRRVGWAEEAVAAPGAGLRTKPTILASLDIKGGSP